MRNVDIARTLGITPNNVSLVLKSPLVQHEMEIKSKRLEAGIEEGLQSTVMGAKIRLEHCADLAAQVHENIVSNPEEYTPEQRQKSADAILDRVLGREQKQAGQVTVLNVEKLQMVMAEAGLSFGLATEQPPTESTKSGLSGDRELIEQASSGRSFTPEIQQEGTEPKP